MVLNRRAGGPLARRRFLLAIVFLISGAAAAADLSEPALPTTIDVQDRPFPPLHYARFPAAPFSGSLRWDQVIQGQLGSCFFLSSLTAVARTRPSLLDGAIRRDGDAFVVTLSSADGTRVPVAVDDRLPATAEGAPFFARGRDAGERRPALFEKAYAKFSGGYEAINGGEPADALRALTGAAAEQTALAGMTEDALWDLLTRAERARRPVVAGTPELEEMRRRTGRDDLRGLIEDHVYVVLGRAGSAKRRAVLLYTPLSPRDAGDAPDDRRRRTLTLAEFKKYFESVAVGSFPG